MDAMSAVAGHNLAMQAPHRSFSLENGAAQLATSFSSVTLHRRTAVARVPDPTVVADYVDSMDDALAPVLGDHGNWADVVAVVAERAAAHIAQHGTFDVTSVNGIFICR
jgi:hypothetical protein